MLLAVSKGHAKRGGYRPAGKVWGVGALARFLPPKQGVASYLILLISYPVPFNSYLSSVRRVK